MGDPRAVITIGDVMRIIVRSVAALTGDSTGDEAMPGARFQPADSMVAGGFRTPGHLSAQPDDAGSNANDDRHRIRPNGPDQPPVAIGNDPH